jgi:hypothetical protein
MQQAVTNHSSGSNDNNNNNNMVAQLRHRLQATRKTK